MDNSRIDATFHPPAEGKSCGECSLCCMVMPVSQIGKSAGVWCRHADQNGGGCAIHETRPDICRVFHCHWMTNPELSVEWKPDQCGFVLFHRADGNMWLSVDPNRPDAWRAPRFYQPLKNFATKLLREKAMLTVHVGDRCIVVLPDSDADLGVVAADKRIEIGMKLVHGRPVYRARVVAATATGST